DHAAGLDAWSLAGLVDLDRHLDLLVAADLAEIDVHVAHVEALALARTPDREVLLAVDLEVDNRGRTVRRMEEVEQVLARHRDRDRLEAGGVHNHRAAAPPP